jgi:SAM-dependent methyltransferase
VAILTETRDQDLWDERYRSRSVLWSGQPNAHLVTEAADLVPGTALDAGCGEGADAVWLAERGWQVTAVDFSVVALERGAEHARTLGAEIAERIHWQQADLLSWVPAAGYCDLVSAHFMHFAKEAREPLHRRLAAAVAPGGILLIVGHHPSDLQTTVPRPPTPERFYTAAEVSAVLDPAEWEILAEDARPREVQDPEGRDVTIHDTVLKARRRVAF